MQITTKNYIYISINYLGSGSAITNSAGNAVQILDYAPFGEDLLDLNNGYYNEAYQFAGYLKDAESGMYYMGARYNNSKLSINISTEPMWRDFPSISPYAVNLNNPIMLVDPDGNSPKPPRSRISYAGNGVFNVNINSLNRATRNNYHSANLNPSNWSYNSQTGQRDLGISTQVAEMSIQNSSITSNPEYSPVGVDKTTIKTVGENAKSTGMPDRRVGRTFNTVGSGCATARGAAFMLALDVATWGYDLWNAISINQDRNAINTQQGLLGQSFEAFKKGITEGLVPLQYINTNDAGAIINFIFQGVNDTGNPDIGTIGTNILQSIGRYDKSTQQPKPLINE